MAKSWTLKEAVKAIQSNDVEALNDFGRRMPVLTGIITKAVVGDKEGLNQMFDLLPDHCTLNRMNANLMENVGDVEENEETTEEKAVEKETKAKKTEKVSSKAKVEDEAEEDGDECDYENMTTKQLYQKCIDNGLKVSKYGKNKTYYIEQLKSLGELEESNDESDEDDDENSYAGISPANLYKECRKRGIKTKPRLDAGAYIALLKEDDAKASESNDEDDDWGEEEETPKAKKVEKKVKSTKKTKKSAPQPEPETEEDDDDDDENWDI